jgi:hypothetical protein
VDDMRKNEDFLKIVWIHQFGRRSEYCPTKGGNNIFLEGRSAVLRESEYAILRREKGKYSLCLGKVNPPIKKKINIPSLEEQACRPRREMVCKP